MEQILTIVILIISIILHEMAHGHAANALGDPTARLQGRLSPNPIVHIDLFGSIIVPGLLLLSNAGILFGWAKPVPYNPYNLKGGKCGEPLVALAGPAVNIFLALVFGLLYRFGDVLSLSGAFLDMSWYIVYINILLALFNLIPLPPLDGSKILPALLPYKMAYSYRQFVRWAEQYGAIGMFVAIFVLINLFSVPFFGFVMSVVGFITGTGA
jgi:Zn-dependent protease